VAGDQPGEICTIIDFEGLRNRGSIPVFDGISSPGWLSLIDRDAGGTGNIAFEPSPSTVAFWRADPPASRDIVFTKPVSEVRFSYASAVPVFVDAFDQDGNVVASATGDSNVFQGPGGDPTGDFNQWDPLLVFTTANSIWKIRVSGNVNQTGMDDLKTCFRLQVHSVEFTQAIQEWQALDELYASLFGNGEPPVPIVALKPAMLRVYMDEVTSVSSVRIKLRILGDSSSTSTEKWITLQPSCSPERSRLKQGKCQSADLYFVPPEGHWTAFLEVYDLGGRLFEDHEFELHSRTARPILQVPVTVCEELPDIECGDGQLLAKLLPLLRASAPTHRVATVGDIPTVTIQDGLSGNLWWGEAWAVINGLRLIEGSSYYYHGIARREAPGDTGGIGLPRAAVSRFLSLTGADFVWTQATVAHETGHMLGRPHTGTDNPRSKCRLSPSYFFFPADWPYADNSIQEVGFHIANRTAMDPQSTFDWMSYCDPPIWISPHTYTKAMEALEASANASTTTLEFTSGMEDEHLLLSGKLEDGGVRFDPVFRFEGVGPTAMDSGAYTIRVLDPTGTTLFSGLFDPVNVLPDTTEEISPTLFFAELVPVLTGADRIVIAGPDDQELGGLVLTGVVPSVTITSPADGAILHGIWEIAWEVEDPDSENHSFWVEYSPDGGGRRIALATRTSRSSLAVDFDKLPGCSTYCLIRILASDGVNTGVATFDAFTSPAKQPTAQILTPADGSVFQTGDLAWFQSLVWDPDDGFLDGGVEWSSSIDGVLGDGDELRTITLSEGVHQVTLRATDSDGNIAIDNATIHVDGTSPTIQLSVNRDGVAARCVVATLSASDDPTGSGLSSLEYSLDAGASWISTSTSEPELSFTVPGSGFFHLIVRAEDLAGNLSAEESRFFTAANCEADVADFVLLGEEGVWVEQNATVVSGDIGANTSSSGPYMAEGSEVIVGIGAVIQDAASRVMGDSVYVKNDARVYDVYYSELGGLGNIVGDHHTPLELPLVNFFPDVPAFLPGTQDFDVPQGGSLALDAGDYGLLRARLGSRVTFSGGVYNFSEWDVGEDVLLHFQAPSEIRIAGKLALDQGSFLGPEQGLTGLSARDIVIFVTGLNGSSGNLGGTPKAAKFGIGTTIHANVYVPYGTLWLRQNGQYTGAFLAKWVDLGIGATVEHLSRWSQGSGGQP
jgi:hypothetical protein